MKKKDYSGRYYSTNDFVGTNQLEAFAKSVFGEGWEAEDDYDQIITLLSHLEVELNYDVSWDGSSYIFITAINQIQTQ